MTEVLQIPDLEGEEVADGRLQQVPILQTTDIESMTQLNKVLSQRVDSSHSGIDISLLTSVIKEQSEIAEKDIGWRYESLQIDIAKAVYK